MLKYPSGRCFQEISPDSNQQKPFLSMKTAAEHQFEGQTALIRVDFNVKLDEHYRVIDDARIKAALPTIQRVLDDGGSVVLMSHMGRPKGRFQESSSFRHLVPHLESLLRRSVTFQADITSDHALAQTKALRAGDVVLLENLRFHPEEKQNDDQLARTLARLGDVYINDAFGTAHRSDASTSAVATYFPAHKRMLGSLMTSELSNADKVAKHPDHPYTAVIGGSKVSDKIQLIRSLMQKADNIVIGGGMTYTFLKAQGYNIGASMLESEYLELAKSLMTEASQRGVTLYLPEDSIACEAISGEAAKQVTAGVDVPEKLMGADIGPKTIEKYSEVIKASRTVFWNGPVGVFEVEGLQEGTYRLALAVSDATQNGAFSLIGGGDTATAFEQFNLTNRASFISTGGGALLTYIAGEPLPAVEATEASD